METPAPAATGSPPLAPSPLLQTIYGAGRFLRFRALDDICEVKLTFGKAYLKKESISNINAVLRQLLLDAERKLLDKKNSTTRGKGGGGGGGGPDVGSGGGGGGGGGCRSGAKLKVLRAEDLLLCKGFEGVKQWAVGGVMKAVWTAPHPAVAGGANNGVKHAAAAAVAEATKQSEYNNNKTATTTTRGACGGVGGGVGVGINTSNGTIKTLLLNNNNNQGNCLTTTTTLTEAPATATVAGGGDRVQAFLSRTKKMSAEKLLSAEKTIAWIRPLAGTTGMALGALAAVLVAAAAFTIGYRYGVASTNLENTYVQLAQVKFDEALTQFERQTFVANGAYQTEYDRLLAEQSGSVLEMFDRSTTTLGELAGGGQTVRGTRAKLQAELMLKQLKLSGQNAVKGTEVLKEDWEFDDRTINTGLDECRCRAVLMNRSARKKITRADGVVTFSEWGDHGQIGQCSWKEVNEMQGGGGGGA
eukprot:GHVS01080577.1.p1 GENE.GHVS01080577.1~~GHVS01080577.1.p1  ORF type:complete len:518 (-),score=184.09 GHVS01080577.1:89-1507(-)